MGEEAAESVAQDQNLRGSTMQAGDGAISEERVL